MLSPDGKSKTFDKDANGYVRGEGAGALLLKPLSKALADGDNIHAIIRGSVVNHGGRVNTMTAPNPNAQADMIKRAFADGDIDPASVTYMEAHGTGTSLGDPIEVNGLKKAFREMFKARGVSEPPVGYCGVGSVKTNLGHLETSAAMAGILKVILAMKAKKLPPSLHLKTLNPYINFEGSPFYHVDRLRTWEPARDASGRPYPRRAGVSSMGFGGVTGHIRASRPARASSCCRPRPTSASARTPRCWTHTSSGSSRGAGPTRAARSSAPRSFGPPRRSRRARRCVSSYAS
jgi:acyl transferase domain-containing protein